jgi:hypothetical protein
MSDAPLAFSEFSARERVPLADVFRLVFAILRTRPDAAIYGSQALNAYVKPPRMTEDVDIFSLDATDLAETIRAALNREFHVAIRIRRSADGKGLRLYQTSKEARRHLVDVRPTATLPPTELVDGVQAVRPDVLVAMKIIASVDRAHVAKRAQDLVDIGHLLRKFPALRGDPRVEMHLHAFGAPLKAFEKWSAVRASQSPQRLHSRGRGSLTYDSRRIR